MSAHVLCRAGEIAEGAARSFVVGEGSARRDIVIVRKHGRFYAYANACPHQRMPLETFPGRFLNEDGSLFVCSTHGARFRIEDGHCISGPCEGKSLTPLAIAVVDGTIMLTTSAMTS